MTFGRKTHLILINIGFRHLVATVLLLFLAYQGISNVDDDDTHYGPDVYVLLKIISSNNDWSNLYKIFESLETFAVLKNA